MFIKVFPLLLLLIISQCQECVDRDCLDARLARILKFIIIGDADMDPQQHSIGHTVSVTEQQQYLITIRFNDNQLLSDTNSLTYQVYQTENSHRIDATNKWVSSSGIPQWPRTKLKWSDSHSEISFLVSRDDLQERECLQYNQGVALIYQCSFELAFSVKQVKQVSYHFNVRFTLNTDLKSKAADTVEVTNFELAQETPRRHKKSRLYFCEDESCGEITPTPPQSLYLNGEVYLKHMCQEYMEDTVLILQALGYTAQVEERHIEVQTHPGYKIYKIKAPIVTENLYITAISRIAGEAITKVRVEGGQVHRTRDQATQFDQDQLAVDYNSQQQGGVLTWGIKMLFGQ